MSKESLIKTDDVDNTNVDNTNVDNATDNVDNTNSDNVNSIEYPENFPQEFRESPVLMKYVDKESNKIDYGKALTGLIHAQKMVGADKILKPSKTATEDDWNNVFRQLGNPEKLEDYKVESKDFNPEDPMSKGFMEAAHKAGVLPKQAGAIVDFFTEANANLMEQREQEIDQDYQDELRKLKSDWGDKFDNQVSLATKAFQDIFDADEQKLYKERGLLDDPVFVRAMNRVGQSMLDDSTFNGNEETDKQTTAENMKQSYMESYAIVAKGDKTNPAYEHHRKNLHKLNERAGRMGISLV